MRGDEPIERRDDLVLVERRVGVFERHPQHRAAALRVEIVVELDEPGEQIDFGQQQVDRGRDVERAAQLDQAVADAGGVAIDSGEIGLEQLIDAQRDDYPVDRLLGPVGLELAEQAAPALRIGGRIRILAGIAARGVDDRSLVGEPEVEVAGAADAFERLVGERKAQARIEQRGGLARARRADNHIPRAAVEIVALAARGLLELLDRLAHPLLDDRILGRA